MGKRKERLQNPEPFMPISNNIDSVKSLKARSRALKQHQKEANMIESNMSSKIMKETLI
ncbi:hypothetical protein TanjilG_05266 [Lupinus angustifolius]|uniref:Uncharacterized protein n=1 Tax=Lupinus angustifolius TaxID=3871 RepID=A0A4P1RB85_LUPAN|nr:hypothetical protein TanjilG_05266 [Lupinus angustifolius]